jgi:hypothetical protein
MQDKKTKIGCVIFALVVGAIIWLSFFTMGGCNPTELNLFVN